MNPLPPSEAISGTVLVFVPHYDDEALACGGTLAGLRERDRVHVVYVTSGRGSEDLGMPGVEVDASVDMGEVRRQESLAALRVLGIPEHNARFLDVPDYGVADHEAELRERVARIVDEVRPDFIFAPFRYDRHTDHVALHRVAAAAAMRAGVRDVLEYFVYYRWKLLPGGDVRKHIRDEWLITVDIGPQAETKRAALECFVSQTTLYFPWQTRPVLSAELIAEVCGAPEVFLRADHAGEHELFRLPLWVIRFVHAIEPALKRWKDKWCFLAAAQKRRPPGSG